MFWTKVVRSFSAFFPIGPEPVPAEKLLPELDQLEEILIRGDVPPALAAQWLADLQQKLRAGALRSPDQAVRWFQEKLKTALASSEGELTVSQASLSVFLIVGVNGSGKTTTVAKLAAHLKSRGHSVLLAAADTFRAGAIEQLQMWGDRLSVPVVAQKEGADGAAVAFDAIASAKAKEIQIVLVDTAGRLHTKTPLMDELQKMKRVIGREVPGAPHEILLVVDGSVGQNGLAQADVFHKTLGLTGVILSKYDGTAKGGVILGIHDRLGLPVKFLGVGEKPENLIPFRAGSFIEALL